MSNEPPTDNITATEVSCTIVPASSSPKKLVALPSEATVMVDGQKCVLRVDHNTGRLLACPVAGGKSKSKCTWLLADSKRATV